MRNILLEGREDRHLLRDRGPGAPSLPAARLGTRRAVALLTGGLGVALSLFLIGGQLGCQGSTTNNDNNFRPVDSRRSLGNALVGTTCNDRNPCAKDDQGVQPRCATAHQFDAVGFCAPECKTDADCDTTAPGLARCTNMSGRAECVLFCDRNMIQTSKLCPDGWTCEAIQSYFTCVPPQSAKDGGT